MTIFFCNFLFLLTDWSAFNKPVTHYFSVLEYSRKDSRWPVIYTMWNDNTICISLGHASKPPLTFYNSFWISKIKLSSSNLSEGNFIGVPQATVHGPRVISLLSFLLLIFLISTKRAFIAWLLLSLNYCLNDTHSHFYQCFIRSVFIHF